MTMTSATTAASAPLSRDETGRLLGHTMGLVALTAGLFALGAYIGRDTSGGWAILWFVAAIAVLLGMNAAAKRSEQLAVGLLFGFGLLLGLAVAPTVGYYIGADPQAVWQAGGATALFIAGFGAAGYATRRDLSTLARYLLWALVALIVFGIVLVFVQIPGGTLIYAVAGLIIFAGLTLFDFQRFAPHRGHPHSAASRRLDLPRRPQRVPPIPVDLRRQRVARPGRVTSGSKPRSDGAQEPPLTGHVDGRNAGGFAPNVDHAGRRSRRPSP
jgi:modulator of FtsH protease